MEYWDVLDSNRNLTGKTVLRGNPLKQDEYHLVVHVWIKNSKNQFLISKRTPNKSYPGMWETTGGSAVSGDDSLKTALKETLEELGLKLESHKGEIIFQMKRSTHPDFLDVWLFEQEVDLNTLKFQHDEVSAARWVDKEEIKKMILTGKFVPVFDYLDDLFKRYS